MQRSFMLKMGLGCNIMLDVVSALGADHGVGWRVCMDSPHYAQVAHEACGFGRLDGHGEISVFLLARVYVSIRLR